MNINETIDFACKENNENYSNHNKYEIEVICKWEDTRVRGETSETGSTN